MVIDLERKNLSANIKINSVMKTIGLCFCNTMLHTEDLSTLLQFTPCPRHFFVGVSYMHAIPSVIPIKMLSSLIAQSEQ